MKQVLVVGGAAVLLVLLVNRSARAEAPAAGTPPVPGSFDAFDPPKLVGPSWFNEIADKAKVPPFVDRAIARAKAWAASLTGSGSGSLWSEAFEAAKRAADAEDAAHWSELHPSEAA